MTEEAVARNADSRTATAPVPEGTAGERVAPAAEEANEQQRTHEAVIQLTTLLRAGAELEEHLKEILDRELGGPLTSDTFESLGRRLAEYLGEDLSHWLFLFLTIDQPEEYVEAATDVRDIDNLAQLLDILRWLRAIYGRAAVEAYNSWQEPDNAWMRLDRRVHYDQIARSWIVQLEIRKYNQEVMTIAGSPTSILQFTRYFLATLNALPEPGQFLPEQLQQFLDELDTFRRKFPLNTLAKPEIDSEAAQTP